MAIIDNTLASQVDTFNPATPLAQAAQIQSAQDTNRQAQFKQAQLEMGSEARGLQPFVNTPEFPAKWAETADRLHAKGLLDDQSYQKWRNTPSPLVLKSMISATDDPALDFRKTEAVREQGNTDRSFGLQKTNADRNYLLAKRAADSRDDPTPDNFVEDKSAPGGYRPIGPADPSYIESVAAAKARAAASAPPESFEVNPAAATDPTQPKYRPVTGGPTDPNYLQSAAAAKAKIPRIVAPGEAIVDMGSGKESYKNSGGNGTLPDETADFAAEQILLGAKGVKTGYGRGAQGPENIAKIDAAVARKAKEQGLTAADLVQRGIDLVGDTSRERTAATQEGRMTAAGIEASGAIKLGLEASEKVPRTNWVPVNKAIQAYQAGTSDPYLKAFGAANLTIVNTYARAINPTGNGNVHDKVEAATKLLNEADGPEAYKAVAAQMQREIDLAHKSPAMARDSFRKERASRVGGAKPAAPDRFKQLTDTGLSKEEAYAKMHEEGY